MIIEGSIVGILQVFFLNPHSPEEFNRHQLKGHKLVLVINALSFTNIS